MMTYKYLHIKLFGLLLFINLISSQTAVGQNIKNPILTAHANSPAICKVNKDYFMVTASGKYFPAIPLYHSQNLQDWTAIGHVLSDPLTFCLAGEQNNQDATISSAAIYHHKHFYYVLYSISDPHKSLYSNYIVSSVKPTGPWQGPYLISQHKEAGNTPSLFFDPLDIEKVWYTQVRPAEGSYGSRQEIWLQRLNTQNLNLEGPVYNIWASPPRSYNQKFDSPRLFRHADHFYLIFTENIYTQAQQITITRSQKITGPYTPIDTLINEDKAAQSDFQYAKQTDFLPEKSHSLMLCSALPKNTHQAALTGLQAVFAPLKWDNQQPAINNDCRCIKSNQPPNNNNKIHDDFNQTTIAPQWHSLWIPDNNWYSLKDRPGFLRLKCLNNSITENGFSAFLCQAIHNHKFEAATRLEFSPKRPYEQVGLVLYKSHRQHLSLMLQWQGGKTYLKLIERQQGQDKILKETPINSSNGILLKIKSDGEYIAFYHAKQEHNWQAFYDKYPVDKLQCPEKEQPQGAYCGVYASSNGQISKNYVDIDWFVYQNMK